MRTIEQRNATLETVIRVGVEAGTKNLRCAAPAIIKNFNPVSQTVTAQIALKEVLNMEGVETETEIPLLVDVPLVTPRAGGYSLVFVPSPGDECLIVFSDMCIDAWWQSGGVQSQAERRRHDLSDGFAILGCWSQPRRFENYPTEGMRLQSDDGETAIIFDHNGCHLKNIDVGLTNIDVGSEHMTVGVEIPEETETLFKCNYKAEFTDSVKFSSVQLDNPAWDTISNDEVFETVDDVSLQVTKIMGVVYMRGVIKLVNELTSGQSRELFELSEEYRPTCKMRICLPYKDTRQSTQSNNTVQIEVGTDGKVILINNLGQYDTGYSGYTGMKIGSDKHISFNCSWVK